MFLKHLVIICLSLLFLPIKTQAQPVGFKDPNPGNTEKIFGDPTKKTSSDSQAIYDEGGQSPQYRMTEAERGLDFIKKELKTLKEEVDMLKGKIEELQANAQKANSFKSINEYTPANRVAPKPTPF